MGILVGQPVLELVEQEIGLQEFESVKLKDNEKNFSNYLFFRHTY